MVFGANKSTIDKEVLDETKTNESFIEVNEFPSTFDNFS